MSVQLSSLIDLHLFTPGRRVATLRQLLGMADTDGLRDLIPPIEQALAHERDTADLARAWAVTRPDAPPISLDPQVERNLILIDRFLRHHATRDGDIGEQACGLSIALFPQGVSRHIRLPFVEQLAANEQALRVLDSTGHATWVDRLGLRALVMELRDANQPFARAMRQHDGAGTTYEAVRDARERGQTLFLEVVVRILGKCVSGDDTGQPSTLLGPIHDQDDAIALDRRQRRRLLDIDPDSGAPVETIRGEDQPALPADDLASMSDEVLDFDGAPIPAPEAN